MCSYPPPGRAWGIWSGLQDQRPRLAAEVATSEDNFRRFYYWEARLRAALAAYRQALHRSRPVIDRAHYAAALASWRSRGQRPDAPAGASGSNSRSRGFNPVPILPAPEVKVPAITSARAAPANTPGAPWILVRETEDDVTPRVQKRVASPTQDGVHDVSSTEITPVVERAATPAAGVPLTPSVPSAEKAVLDVIDVDAEEPQAVPVPGSASLHRAGCPPRTRQRRRVDYPRQTSPASL
eukprot:IDg1403t1